MPILGCCDSSVGIALGYGLDDRGSRVRFPAGAGNFSLHHRVKNGSGAHPAPYPMGTMGSFPRGKADHSLPSSAQVKNAWSYTSTTPIRLRGVVLSGAQGQYHTAYCPLYVCGIVSAPVVR
jgi:hypothetical protein